MHGLDRLRQLLIEPASTIGDRPARRTARLLATMLLIMIVLFAVLDMVNLHTIPGYVPPWYGYLVLISAYGLSRTTYYRAGSILILAMFPLVIFFTVWRMAPFELDDSVYYLVLSLFLASIFVTWRGVALLACLNLSGLLLLPAVLRIDMTTPDPLVTSVMLNLIGATLMLVEMRHRDALERDRQATLRTSEERYRMISELVSDYAFAYHSAADGTLRLAWITDAFTRLTGYTHAEISTPDRWFALVHPDDHMIASRHCEQLHTGQAGVCEHRILARDGRVLWLRLYTRLVRDAQTHQVVCIYGAAQDVTQIKRLESQLQHAQKIEAVGVLAGGMAHDFNNLITVILGHTNLLLDDPANAELVRQEAEQIRAALERSNTLTRQLLTFSRTSTPLASQIDLNVVVSEIKPLLQRLTGRNIVLSTVLAPDLGLVWADLGQMEQVLMNLTINARDAMPTGGALTITTANVTIQSGVARMVGGIDRQVVNPTLPDLADGTYVTLTVSDTGEGMDAAIRERIFDPFFTTKPIGKGTGLGLAIVQQIVVHSGGQIDVTSAPGQGTTFTIFLPLINAPDPVEEDKRIGV